MTVIVTHVPYPGRRLGHLVQTELWSEAMIWRAASGWRKAKGNKMPYHCFIPKKPVTFRSESLSCHWSLLPTASDLPACDCGWNSSKLSPWIIDKKYKLGTNSHQTFPFKLLIKQKPLANVEINMYINYFEIVNLCGSQGTYSSLCVAQRIVISSYRYPPTIPPITQTYYCWATQKASRPAILKHILQNKHSHDTGGH